MIHHLPECFEASEYCIRFKDEGSPEVLFAFSIRRNGVSSPPFEALNLSGRQGDHPENVSKNLSLLCDSLSIKREAVISCNQVHGDEVLIFDRACEQTLQGDALITQTSGLFVSVKIADCLPVLLHDFRLGLSVAIHAGWGGSALRICSKTMNLMKRRFGSDPRDVKAILGPCIRACCYEIDERVIDPMKKSYSDWQDFIKPLSVWKARNSIQPGLMGNRTEDESMRLDLAEANKKDLLSVGAPNENIHDIGLCTACGEDLFYSHRRDGGRTGRHMAIVGRCGS